MGPGDVAVSFDSGPALTHPQHRRPPHSPPMQPMIPQIRPLGSVPLGPAAMAGPGSGPGGSGMAFMTFPFGEHTGTYAPPPRMGTGIAGGGFGSSAFEDEPPLLEELGINLPLIARKMVSVLNPIRVNADIHEDGDLSGPLGVCMLFALCQLLAGKVHFGIILGWTSLASLFLYAVFNLLVGGHPQSSLDLYRSCSIVGYSLLPMALFSALSLFVPHGAISLALGGLTALWCTRTCSTLLVNIIPHAEDQRYLIAYSCMLIYTTFALLVLF